MAGVFFTSDLHINHLKSFLYEPRGFASIAEHDIAIVNNWNKIISAEDEVYILGDIIMGADMEYSRNILSQLNGKISFIRGNHDTDNKVNFYESLGWINLGWSTMLKYHKYHFYLSHYPSLCSNYDADKPLYARVINLCGHCHCSDCFKDMDKGLCYHVELDSHNNYPISADKIISDIKEFNLGQNY